MIETEEAIVLTPDEVLDVIVAEAMSYIFKQKIDDSAPGIGVVEIGDSGKAYVMGIIYQHGEIDHVLDIGLLEDDVSVYEQALKSSPYAHRRICIDPAAPTTEEEKAIIQRLHMPPASRRELDILRDRQRPFFVAANDLADEAEARQIFEARKDGFRPVAG